MAMLLESSGSLLSSVDALESVAAAASSTSSDWDSSVLTAHERLLKLCEEDAAAAAAEKVATTTATTADALALPFGADAVLLLPLVALDWVLGTQVSLTAAAVHMHG